MVRARIAEAEAQYQRPGGSVQLLAVSKTRSVAEIRATMKHGQWAFGESYLQEALEKIQRLPDQRLEWHFIGQIQSNKTRPIAEHFAWVHSITSWKQLERLNAQRPADLAPLNVCLQINTSGEASKGGYAEAELADTLGRISSLTRLRLRGLMTIPAPADDMEAQRLPFRRLRALRDKLRTGDMPLETLSMGMTDDLEAAIAEGATIVRIGTAIFGPRQYNLRPNQ